MPDRTGERIIPGALAATKRPPRHPVGITAMVSEHERDLIDAAAQDAGLSRAAWARRTLLAALAAAPGPPARS